MRPLLRKCLSMDAIRKSAGVGCLLAVGLACCATGQRDQRTAKSGPASTAKLKKKPAGAPIFEESQDTFINGLVIPEGYPMKPIVDLSFGYGDDPPVRERCFAHLPPRTAGLVVCTGLQGGIFRVAARVRPNVPGVLFLRAVEPIRHKVLSAERLKQSTSQPVKPASPAVLVEYYTEDAMIYEGDWKDWYPARFELWLQPTDGGEALKLTEEVYEINGWRR